MTDENKELLPEVLIMQVADISYKIAADHYGDISLTIKSVHTDIAQAALSVIAPYYEKQIAELEYRREIFNDTRKLLLGDEEIDLAKTYNLSGLHLEQILQSHANLEKQIAELKAQIPQWLPIEEYNAEKHGKRILAYGTYQWEDYTDRQEEGFICFEQYDGSIYDEISYWKAVNANPYCDRVQPTHFMPLPQPPEKE